MALNPEFNTVLADQAFTIYTNAETQMLDKVARRVERGITTPGWAERKQAEMTALRRDLSKITKDIDLLHKANISDKLNESYLTGVRSAEADLGLPLSIFSGTKIPRSVQRMILETDRAISGTSLQLLRSAEDGFRKIQAEVSMAILTGVETRAQAGRRMLNMMADQGLTGFVDKAGRKWEAATYAEMATRTTSMRAAVQGHIDRQAEMGNDLVIISSHHAPCPVCEPWEGVVLSISGEDDVYQALDEAIGDGLFHPNCEHNLSGYIERLSREPRFKSTEQREEKALQYQYVQKQRANERAIRKWKRREVASITPLDQRTAHNKVLQYQANQRALLKDYESRFGVSTARKYSRESIANRTGIAGANKLKSWSEIKPRELPAIIKGKAEKAKAVVKEKVDKVKEKWVTLRAKMAGTGKHKVEFVKHVDNLDKMFDDMPVELKQAIAQLDESKNMTSMNKWVTNDTAYYQPGSKVIVNDMARDAISAHNKGNYSVFWHEFGHSLDHNLAINLKTKELRRVIEISRNTGISTMDAHKLMNPLVQREYISNSPKFISAMREDYKYLVNKGTLIYGKSEHTIMWHLRAEESRIMGWTLDYNDLSAVQRSSSYTNGIQDMVRGFSTLDKAPLKVNWGHASAYYKSDNEVAEEVFAQMTSSLASRSAEGKVMLELMPNTSKAYMELIEEALEILK